MMQLLWKTVWQFLKKLNMELLWLNSSTPSYMPQRNWKARTGTDICLPLFMALSKVAKRWKQPKCSLKNEWINKMHYIHEILFIQRNEVLIHATTWMNLENKVKKTEKWKYCMISQYEASRIYEAQSLWMRLKVD